MPLTPDAFDAFLDAFGGDEELLRIVIRAFLDGAPDLLLEVRSSCEANDADRLRLAAHALKCSVRFFGETAAYQLAYQLELAAAVESLDSVKETLPRLEEEIEQLRQALAPLVAPS